MKMDYANVLDFWFGPPAERPYRAREFWFRKSDAVDTEIRTRFGPTIEAALANRLESWTNSPDGTRALILVLDQFTRNAFRDTPRSFSGDAAALTLARRMVDAGVDRHCDPIERWFIYMPFEHSENLADQHESLRLFRGLAADGLNGPLEWAQKHLDVIQRFGRFPHRNEILGRPSNAEEIAFLQLPGARF
jgi:uncharacterized protein (DUF924 family)